MSAKSKRRRVRKTVQHQSAAPKTWAQRARASTWVFVLEFAAIAAAIWGVYETSQEIRQSREFRENTEAVLAQKTFEQIEEDARAREQEALARNWALLTTHASGNSGKGQALEYLASKGVVLDGIDLSCKTMGGMDMDKSGKEICARRTYLRDVDLSEDTHAGSVFLIRSNLSGADLLNADLSGAFLAGADLSGAGLLGTDLSRAELLEAGFSGAELLGTDLSRAGLLEADFSGAYLFKANFSGANLTGADFTGGHNIDSANFKDAWAWADEPPIDLKADIDLCVFDEDTMDRLAQGRPTPCIPPED